MLSSGWSQGASCLLCALVAVALYYLSFYKFNLIRLCDLDSRPVIFGEDLCPRVESGALSVDSLDLVTKVLLLFSYNVVFWGSLAGQPIVLKRLAHDSEFREFEEASRKAFPLLDRSRATLDRLTARLRESLVVPKGSQAMVKLQVCPEPSTVEEFIRGAIEGVDLADVNTLFHLWTMFHLNPEPFVLKVLQSPHWPVPKYYGSCGRLSAFQDCGMILSNFYNSQWELRANYSLQILEAAFRFTFDHDRYAFYLTDISPDNFAVDSQGVVRAIDLENTIMVDRQKLRTNGALYKGENHTSENFECENCFAYSSESICSHPTSDHNIFAVCREILSKSVFSSQGLLHSAPPDVNEDSPTFESLIEDCIAPKEGQNRFTLAKHIMKRLEKSLKHSAIN